MKKTLNLVNARKATTRAGEVCASVQRNQQVAKLNPGQQTSVNTHKTKERSSPPAYHPMPNSVSPKHCAPFSGNPSAPPVYRPATAVTPMRSPLIQPARSQVRVPTPPIYRPDNVQLLQARMNPTSKNTRNVAPASIIQRVIPSRNSSRVIETRHFSMNVVQRMLSLSSSDGSGDGNDDREDPRKRGEQMSQALARIERVRRSWNLVLTFINQYRQTLLNVLASNVNNYNNNHHMGAALFWLLNGLKNQLEQMWNHYDGIDYEQGADELSNLDNDTAYNALVEEHEENTDIYGQAYALLTSLIDFFQPYAGSFFHHQGNPPVHGLFGWPAPLHPGDMTVQQSMDMEDELGRLAIRMRHPVGPPSWQSGQCGSKRK